MRTSDPVGPGNDIADPTDTSGVCGSAAGHFVQLYENEDFLIRTVAGFIGAGLESGEAVVVIATEPHRRALQARLEVARADGRFLMLDAGETLARFTTDLVPDEARFRAVIGGIIAQAATHGSRVRVFGEMVAEFWHADRRDAAIRLEELWNALLQEHQLSLLCAYPLSAFADSADASGLDQVCNQHDHVIPTERYTALGSTAARLRTVAQLQRSALSLASESAKRNAAEKAVRDRDEMVRALVVHVLAMLGHELRNPLSAVRNALIAAELDPARHVRALEVARHGTEQLVRLVDDLLDVGRIMQGRITLRKVPASFNDIVARAVEAARLLFDERSLAVTLSLPPRDLEVHGDAARLEQVIGSLLGNAAKYTEPGGRVTVALDHDMGRAVLRVCDTGIGISPELLPRVFELFVQGDQALDRARGGLGIGLTLVKELVELHDGGITVASAGTGQGTEFTVRLPATVRPRKRPAPHTVPHYQPTAARVLIVEDNPDAAESLMMLLELLGLRVAAVGDGAAALAAARTNPPDVMLIDIGLPGTNGYELAQQVRQDATLRRAKLFALTGYGQDEDRQRALAAGFDAHLVKPVDVEKLRRLVAGIPRDEADPAGNVPGTLD